MPVIGDEITKQSPTEKYLGRNWGFVAENLKAAKQQLGFDARKEKAPRAALSGMMVNVKAVLRKLNDGKINSVGQVKVRQELGWLVNAAKGAISGLNDEVVTRGDLASLQNKMQAKLETVMAEIAVKAGHEYEDLEAKEASERVARQRVEAAQSRGEPTPDSPEGLDELIRSLASETSPVRGGYWEGRDTDMVRRLRKIATSDSANIRAGIQKANIQDSDEPAIAFVKASVVVRTKPQLQEKDLRSANVNFETIRHGGVKYGGNSFMGQGKNEFVPSMYALLDQPIAIISNKQPAAAPAKKGKPGKQSSATDMLDKLRGDALSILEIKSGNEYLDVLDKAGYGSKFLSSRSFPGVRFVWMLRKAVYNRIGPFQLEECSLLSSSPEFLQEPPAKKQPKPPAPPKSPEELKRQKKGFTQKKLHPSEVRERAEQRRGENVQIPFEDQTIAVSELPPGFGNIKEKEALVALDVDGRGDPQKIGFKYYVFRPSKHTGYVYRVYRSAKPQDAERFCRGKKWKVVKLY